ncbi:uncharacterized protein LOC127104976 [Lathyrus oleraceus]|nr:uncharacterized protein LOC127104976 [Pisum sativum]
MILVILVSFLQSCVGSFDYYMLSEIWPPGYCHNNPCRRHGPKFSKFIIHGLWPQNTTPCETSKLEEFPRDTLGKLEKDWPSITHKPNGLFWQNEWDKHGSCSMLPQIDYFKLTLDLYGRADIKEILRKEGIVSQIGDVKRYTKYQIENAIKSHPNIDAKPQLICYQGNLAEVRLCFDKSPGHKYKNCSTSYTCPLDNIKLPYLYPKLPVMEPEEAELLRAIPPL